MIQTGRDDETYSPLSAFRPRDSASLWTLFVMVFMRAMVQHSRSKASFAIDNILVFVAALFLALVYFNSPVFVAPQPSEVSTPRLPSSCGCPALYHCKRWR
jgi:hypothetical protein